MLNQVPGSVLRTARDIQEAGGRALLVGGAVLDLIAGRAPKDWDIEVFGLSTQRLDTMFPDGNTVGRAFGVLKVTVDGIDIDLNVPRTDNKVGNGHADFTVEVDPNMTVKEAARRRDFTINTLALDLSTGELIDEHGGMADLRAGVLRATDPTLFIQDPLRGLRAMQLLARKAKTVDPATMLLIRGMVDEFPHLAKERVHEEFRKLMLKAERPSVGLEFLRESGWLVHFPELGALTTTGQNPIHHPEGDVWIHSLLAADAAAQVREHIPADQREAFVFGAMLHDVGKPSTTITPEMVAADEAPQAALWTAHGHDMAGMDIAESFLRRMTDKVSLIRLTRTIVGMHMQPFFLTSGNAKRGAWTRLARKMEAGGGNLHLIGRMCQCDACATSPEWQTRSLAGGSPNWEHTASEQVFGWADEFEKDSNALKPKVMGRDLITAGLRPGRHFAAILDKALALQDADSTLTKEDLISAVTSGDI